MKTRYLLTASATLLALLLSACGGGGGDAAPAPTPVPELPQGLWDAPDHSRVVYVLPSAGAAAGEVWSITSGGTSPLVQGELQVEGSGFLASGARYLTGNPADAVDAQVAIQAASDGTLSYADQTVAAGTTTVAGMTASSTYQRVASLGDWEGCWQIAGDAIESQFCVSADGVVSGSRGACVLAGSVALRPEGKAVVTVTVEESGCAEAQSLAGIGVFARSGGQVVEDARMLALMNAEGTQRSLIGLSRAAP